MRKILLTIIFFAQSLFAQQNPIDGDSLTIVVPNAAGGLMARYARMVEPYLEKYLEMQVNIRIMTGGGNIRGTNYVWFAEPDGTTIGFTSIPSLVLAQFSNSPAVQFDIQEFNFLGRVSTEPRVLVVGVQSNIKDASSLVDLGREFIYPSQGTDEDFFTMIILAEAIGLELKPIMGYNGNPDTAMAIIRGDGDGQITSWRASLASMQNGDQIPILNIGRELYEDFPNVPSVLSYAKNDATEAMTAVVDMLDTHRGFFGPPGLSDEVVSYLREKIFLALSDPELLELANQNALPLVPSHGAEEATKINQLVLSESLIMPILESTLNTLR